MDFTARPHVLSASCRIINGKPTCQLECEAARQDGWERSETDDTVFDVPSVLVNDAPGSMRGSSAKSTSSADLIKAPAHVSG